MADRAALSLRGGA